ncbi:MAG TPA: PH domain-containing protein [Acidimicrobiales bacterium]|nr:PH domain-containing protein [Acidimicrobiales bacterium]
MAFPRKLLHDDEQVAADLRPHWWSLAGPTATLVLALVALVALSANRAPDWATVGAGAVTVVALAWFVGRYARWATTSFVVTTDRLISREGVLAKRGIEIPLERVNTVFFDQSLFERVLRYGDLVIESAGEGGRQHFTDIPRPSAIQNEIYRRIEDNQRRLSGGHRPGSVAEELDRLDGLRRRGVLTEEEFSVQKARLLGRR